MPRYEYRPLNPTLAAEKAFLEWIDQLDQEFKNPDPQRRSDVVCEALCERGGVWVTASMRCGSGDCLPTSGDTAAKAALSWAPDAALKRRSSTLFCEVFGATVCGVFGAAG